MKTTEYIKVTIDKLPKGYVFTYGDFITEVNKKEAVIKSLNRLAASGKIVKLSKGKFYKPEQTSFGSLQPNQKQIVKDLLEKDGKLVGYITGYGIYNSLGLTTQVSSIIQIAKNEPRPELKRGMYTVRFIKQKNTIAKENIPLLQLLDAIRYIKKIPDANMDFLCKRLQALLKDLSDNEINTMLRLVQKYPPSARALLGALLESINKVSGLVSLKKSLNPITNYKLSLSKDVLPTIVSWNIRNEAMPKKNSSLLVY